MFVLDRDERSPSEVEKLQRDLGEKVDFLERRELENYLLMPRALLDAIRSKHADDAVIVEKVDNASVEEVKGLIETTAASLYNVVLLKRVRSALEGLKGGLLPRDMAASLAPMAHRRDLPRILRGRIKSRLDEHLAAVDVDQLVSSERQAMNSDWSDPEKRQQLAPGEEILASVFNHFGSEYKKTRDAVRIARHMHADDISDEIKELLKKAASLHGQD